MRERTFLVQGALVTAVLLLFLLTACGESPDEAAPALTFDPGPTFADAGMTPLSLSGSVDPGAAIRVERRPASDAPVVVGLGGLDEEGMQRWEALLPLAEGNNVIIVTAADSRGNSRIIRRTVVHASEVAIAPEPSNAPIPVPENIQVTFARAVEEADDLIVVASVPGTTVQDGLTFTWTPDNPLEGGKSYVVNLTARFPDGVTRSYSWTIFTAP